MAFRMDQRWNALSGRRPDLGVCLFGLLFLLLATGGCTRAHYRCQADQEVYGLVGRATFDPRWHLDDYTICPNPESRMFDPDCPDRPPMPPDDPTAHRLMKCVESKPGWAGWDRCYGKTRWVENRGWRQYLPCDDQGNLVLDRQAAVELALIQSPEYQFALETLYLSALDVTFQRFRFDVQFFSSHSTFFTAEGRAAPDQTQTTNTLDVENSIQAKKLMATGSELVVGAANSLVWQFAGPQTYSATTLLDFSLMQPLLRGAGRAVVLENLTQSERTLLANVRQLERFRRYFYAQIVAGRTLGVGPQRGILGLAALLPPSQAASAGGLFLLMVDQVRIRNQRANIAQLRDSLKRFEEFNAAGRVDGFQVEFARQALYNAQSQLLAIVNTNQDRLDSFKITLGLPPDLKVEIDDPLLRRFNLIDGELTATQDGVSNLLKQLREPQKEATPDLRSVARTAHQKITAALRLVRGDVQLMEKALPRRRADLARLARRAEVGNGDVDTGATSTEAMNVRIAGIREDFALQQRQLAQTLGILKQFAAGEGQSGPAAALEKPRGKALPESDSARLIAFLSRLSTQLAELALTEARARLEAATVMPVHLDPAEALKIARENRLDWMNARAALVDSWRQIEITANALRGNLNVTLSGDMGTIGNNPLQFRSTTGQLRTGVQFDAPLTRLAERNNYREALIDYERARRAYYQFEDRVNQNLRDTLRNIRTVQLDFELRRAGVNVAIKQVELAQLKLETPAKPGAVMTPLEATAARDLIGALSGLLQAQNDFVNQWMDYEAQRLALDLELGTMRVDQRGMWIDPGPIESDSWDKPRPTDQARAIQPTRIDTLAKMGHNSTK